MLFIIAGPVGAITWGEPDGEDHPNVVNLLFVQNGVGFFSCTGTLLTPYVVLTAGHCTEGEGQANDLTFVRNDTDIDAIIQSELIDIWGGDVIGWLFATWVFGVAVPHPQFDDFAGFPDTYDIGLVLLSEPIFVAEYGAMPSLDQFDYLRTARGPISKRQAAIVGYGLQGRIPAFAQDDWARYQATSSLLNMEHSAVSGHQNFVFTNNPGRGSGSGGTCSGDSGGPAFWIDPETGEETNTVMAVNSYGIAPQCNGTDYQFRTDIQEAQDFVNTYIGFTP
jgi:secreted trypsin-like serine protease